MKLTPPKTLEEIAKLINRKFEGEPKHIVSGINEIHQVEYGDLVFVDHPKYYDKAINSAASTIIIDQPVEFPEGKAIIISDQPFSDFNALTKHFSPYNPLESTVGKNVKIDTTAIINPNVVIGNNVSIGKNTIIHPGVIIYDNTTIGDNCVIHGNTVLGADAFYFNKKESEYTKMHSCGELIIENDVEIGALCTLDRGVSGITRIGKGTKIDNKVHIGHDNDIGKNCLIAALVGIAGCVKVEDNVTIWGQVGIKHGVTVGKNASLLGKTGISKSVEGGKTYYGNPAQEARERLKEVALIRKLPEILKKLED